MLIGITGKARSGKNTVASILTERLARYDRLAIEYAFASPIKAACRAVFGWSVAHTDGHLKEVVDPLFGVSPRQAMQTLGTEWGRELINKQLWLLCASQKLDEVTREGHYLLVTDVRFENEATWVRDHGGVVLRVQRDDAAKVNAHASEAGVAPQATDVVIDNNGSLADLEAKVWQFVDNLVG